MDGRNELDERDLLAVEHLQRLLEEDQRHGPPVPDVLHVRRGVALEQSPHVHVLIPLGHPIGQVSQRVGRDVDAPCEEAIALPGGERPVIADDVRYRIAHRPPPSRDGVSVLPRQGADQSPGPSRTGGASRSEGVEHAGAEDRHRCDRDAGETERGDADDEDVAADR